MTTTNKLNITGTRGVPAAHGGFESFAEFLSLYLIESDWQVTVYCQQEGWGRIRHDQWQSVDRVLIPIPFGGAVSTIVFDLLSVLHVCFFSRALTLTLGYNTAVFSLFFRIFGIYNIMNMDGIEYERDKWGAIARLWFRFNEWFACCWVNHLAADHKEMSKHLRDKFGDLPVTTIAYGAETIAEASPELLQPYGLDINGYYIVIARPEPENSIKQIVEGFVNSNSQKKLVVLGKYNQEKIFQAEVLNAADERVCFLGAIYEHDIVNALRFYSYAYIHGHTVGGTNPSLVEAMGAGSMVVAHDNRFNRGVCEDAAIYFKSSKDITFLVEELEGGSNDIENLKNKIKQRHAECYTWDIILDEYKNLLESCGQA